MRLARLVALFIGFALLAIAARAHHSQAGIFNSTKTIEITGVIQSVSWRNPHEEQAEWNLDTYASRVSSAIDEVREITGSDDVNVIGFCAGGIITTTLLNHLAARGDTRVHSMSYAVTMLDFGRPEQLAAFTTRHKGADR